ncbi:MAG: glycosyltransferase family 4 protein [Ardenticatenaceae bacterium]
MRIGLDISICTFNKAGSARYAHSLLQALQKLAAEESVTVVPLSLPAPFQAVAPGIKRKAVTLFWEVAYAPLWLPALARYHQLDVLHLTVPMPIGKFHCPVVTMIHDLIPILFPQWFSFIMGVRLRRWIRYAAQHSTHLLTNSDCTARDLKEHVKPDVPITTTYLGSYLDFPTAPRRAQENLSLLEGRPYILSVGTLEPRKNLRTVLDAYHLLQDRVNNPPNLMVVGATGWMADDVHGRAEQLGIADRVKLTGFVSDEQLQTLYEQATMLVYPSLYEGFGIPPLEAMSSGCSVISSNVSSLPEVVGEAGILIDPTDANALANAMQNLLTDPAQASLLREKGYQQAAGFSWERCAQETLGVYREVA